MDDPDLDPIDEEQKPVLSDSELSDVDEEAFAGIDTSRIGLEEADEEDEGPNVFALKPARRPAGTGERRKKRTEDPEERRRKRQARREEKEQRKREIAPLDELPEDYPDQNQRPEDPEAARRWDLDRAMDSAIYKKQVKRKRKDEEVFDFCSILAKV